MEEDKSKHNKVEAFHANSLSECGHTSTNFTLYYNTNNNNTRTSLSIKSQTLKTTATQTAIANKKTEQPDDKTQPEKLVLQQTPAPSVMIIPKHHQTSKPNHNLQNTTIATHRRNDMVNKCLLCPSIFPPLRL